MTVLVDNMPTDIDFGATGIASVIQNIKTILTTAKGTVPLDRKFGLSFDILDEPLPRSRAKIQTEIFLQLRKYEPRAIVKKIDFQNDPLSGRLAPTVVVDIRF